MVKQKSISPRTSGKKTPHPFQAAFLVVFDDKAQVIRGEHDSAPPTVDLWATYNDALVEPELREQWTYAVMKVRVAIVASRLDVGAAGVAMMVGAIRSAIERANKLKGTEPSQANVVVLLPVLGAESFQFGDRLNAAIDLLELEDREKLQAQCLRFLMGEVDQEHDKQADSGAELYDRFAQLPSEERAAFLKRLTHGPNDDGADELCASDATLPALSEISGKARRKFAASVIAATPTQQISRAIQEAGLSDAKRRRTHIATAPADEEGPVTPSELPVLMDARVELLPEFLRTSEVAEYCDVSEGRVRQWVADDRLPSTKPGRDRLFKRDDVIAFERQPRKQGERRDKSRERP